jgi:hypothetical protein
MTLTAVTYRPSAPAAAHEVSQRLGECVDTPVVKSVPLAG